MDDVAAGLPCPLFFLLGVELDDVTLPALFSAEVYVEMDDAPLLAPLPLSSRSD